MRIEGLRPACAGDLATIQALVAAAYGPYVAAINVRPGPMDDDYAAAIAAGQVQVVDRGGALAGLLVLIPQADAMLLDNIATDPLLHGQGLGRALMDLAVEQARAAGYARLRLYTHERMVRNQAIYARAGFAETHRVTENGLHRVYMEKPL